MYPEYFTFLQTSLQSSYLLWNTPFNSSLSAQELILKVKSFILYTRQCYLLKKNTEQSKRHITLTVYPRKRCKLTFTCRAWLITQGKLNNCCTNAFNSSIVSLVRVLPLSWLCLLCEWTKLILYERQDDDPWIYSHWQKSIKITEKLQKNSSLQNSKKALPRIPVS